MRSRMFRLIPGVVLVSAALVLVALAGVTPWRGPAQPAAAAPGETYIYVSSMGNLEFFSAHKYGWKWAGKTLGVNAKYVGPAEVDINGEVAAFEQAIAEKPAGIAVFAWDPVLTPLINKAWSAGIPVVTILGDLPNSKRIAYVGSPQRDLGFVGGQQIAKVLGGKGKVVVLSLPGVQMFDDRAAGFKDAFKGFKDIEVVQTVDTKADIPTSVNAAKSMLQRYPDLAAFVGTDSTAGIGAATAVKEAGKAGKVRIVSMDRNSDVLQAIQNGTITGTVAQDDAAMAFWALQTLYNFKHRQAPLTSNNAKAGVITGPSQVLMTVNWVDKNNLQYFLAANKVYAGK